MTLKKYMAASIVTLIFATGIGCDENGQEPQLPQPQEPAPMFEREGQESPGEQEEFKEPETPEEDASSQDTGEGGDERIVEPWEE